MRICIIIPQQIIILVLELDYLVPGTFPSNFSYANCGKFIPQL